MLQNSEKVEELIKKLESEKNNLESNIDLEQFSGDNILTRNTERKIKGIRHTIIKDQSDFNDSIMVLCDAILELVKFEDEQRARERQQTEAEIAEAIKNYNIQLQDQLQEQLQERFTSDQNQTDEKISEAIKNYNIQLQEQLRKEFSTHSSDESYKELLSTLQEMQNRQEVKNRILEKRISESLVAANPSDNNKDMQGQLTELPDRHPDEKTKTDHSAKGSAYSQIDYYDFENHFRGPVELITERQKIYIPYFSGHSRVMDLGCGRGEFLQLMKDNNIDAFGVDLYEEFVELCRMHNLNAAIGDALEALSKQPDSSLGGIFAGQLVEHLSTEQVITLCRLAHAKLEPGAYLIMETPNPMCLSIFSNSFYVDPSHNKPVHPLLLQYLTEKAGFADAQILFTELSKVPVKIPELKIENVPNIEQFNESMRYVENLLFGSQDYAVVAEK